MARDLIRAGSFANKARARPPSPSRRWSSWSGLSPWVPIMLSLSCTPAWDAFCPRGTRTVIPYGGMSIFIREIALRMVPPRAIVEAHMIPSS